jgi:hypothetical protein
LITELKSRLLTTENRFHAQHLLPRAVDKITDDHVASIYEAYRADIDLSLEDFLTFYFDFFIYFFVVFSTKIHNFERSFSLSESSSVPPCRFLLEVMVQSVVG